MLKKLLIAIILFPYAVQSQNYVKGTLNSDENYSWVVLYQLKGVQQLYVKNTTIVNSEFSIDFPENSPTGIYRLLYSQQNSGFVDFMYNNETVELKFDPKNPLETVEFITSEENKIYQEYLLKLANWLQELDSYQITYFNLEDQIKKDSLQLLYVELLPKYESFQTNFEKISEGKLANNFIKSSQKQYAPELIETPQEFLNSEKQHYFDFINFDDKKLLNSTFLSDRIIDYIFYLNGSDDFEVQNVLYKKAVKEVMQKITDAHLKSDLLTTLLYTFAQIENTVLIDFLIENFHNKLPVEIQNKSVIKDIQEKVKLAVGKIAPEITWQENGLTQKLSELTIAETYIVVFWSTSCSHCLKEIPKLYEYTKDKIGVHVIAIALEKEEEIFNQKIVELKKWTNILGLKKWKNQKAIDYQINATPSYFILDRDKKIIAKPNYFRDVKVFFED